MPAWPIAYRALAMTGDQDPRRDLSAGESRGGARAGDRPGALPRPMPSQGFIRFWYDWDWAGAEASFRARDRAQSQLRRGALAYAHLLSNLGRNAEASAQARQAMALDPLSPLVNTLSSTFLRIAGDADEGATGAARRRSSSSPILDRAPFAQRHGDGARRPRRAIVDLPSASELCGGNAPRSWRRWDSSYALGRRAARRRAAAA